MRKEYGTASGEATTERRCAFLSSVGETILSNYED